MVGDDRERLEGSLRETTGVPAKDVALHLLMEGRVGEEPPAPRDLTKLKASVGVGVLCRKFGQRS